MTLASWILFLIAAIGLAWIMHPLIQPERVRERHDPYAQKKELLAQREMLFASIKDLEDDREAGRLDEDDYEALRADLDQQCVKVLDNLAKLPGEAC